jgi:hypothetical protein
MRSGTKMVHGVYWSARIRMAGNQGRGSALRVGESVLSHAKSQLDRGVISPKSSTYAWARILAEDQWSEETANQRLHLQSKHREHFAIGLPAPWPERCFDALRKKAG